MYKDICSDRCHSSEPLLALILLLQEEHEFTSSGGQPNSTFPCKLAVSVSVIQMLNVALEGAEQEKRWRERETFLNTCTKILKRHVYIRFDTQRRVIPPFTRHCTTWLLQYKSESNKRGIHIIKEPSTRRLYCKKRTYKY